MKTKVFLYPTAFILIIFYLSGCTVFGVKSNPTGNSNSVANNSGAEYKEARKIGTIQDDAVRESSGIAASRKNRDIYWTHNDSGDDAFLYAFDRSGKKRGIWKVNGAKNSDWEDIAAYSDKQTGESYLLIGDIGNNDKKKKEAVIYRVVEPQINPADANSTKKNPLPTAAAEAIRVEYPNAPHDAESLLVNPNNGDIYIISKTLGGEAEIYKLSAPYSADKKQTLKKIGTIGVPSLTPGFLTGGDISPDGKRVVLTDYFAAYELTLPEKSKNFDDIWKEKPKPIDLGERKQGEAICYQLDGQAVIATSEKKPSPIIEAERK